jgi:hypothetical protein
LTISENGVFQQNRSGTVLHFTAMSGGSMTDTGPSCPNGSCALLSRHSVDLLQRRQSIDTVEKLV